MAMNLHGTCVAIEGNGVLLRGAPGSGKSDLALRLIDQYADAILVADDRVDIVVRKGLLYASPPPNIAGKLEVRGVGIVHVSFRPEAPLRLLVDLVGLEQIQRMPEPEQEEISGVLLPRVRLAPFTPSAPAILRQAVKLSGVQENPP
ncbi:MAG: HPr kinase/phosphorylase [Pseudomonadota bacterium]|jgi:HPr kinase/phosphorylase|nr:hypothetical protein [Alphaproteobacteria bacterium]